MQVEYVDASTGQEFSELKIAFDDNCELQRPRETEKDASFAPKSIDKLLFVLWCPNYFSIMTGNGAVVYESTALPSVSGRLLKSFSNLDQTMQVLMFEDLSMHYVKNGNHMWTLEQSIAYISKVEVFDKASLPKTEDEDSIKLNYLR